MNPVLRCKLHLNSKIVNSIKTHISKEVSPTSVSKLLFYGVNADNGKVYLRLPFKSFKKIFPESTKDEFIKFLKLPCDNVISSVVNITNSENEPNIIFNIEQRHFIEDVLLNNCPYNAEEVKKENIVMDFSSPNIAKPFHMGHLRSTIIGNFLANLYQHLGHNVTRLTYLGDWGTQFGLLQVGLHELNLSNAELKQDPMGHLFNAYVTGNKLAEGYEEVADEARKIFCQLESGGVSRVMERWKMVKKVTVEELTKTYARLGVQFDDYHWESMYNAKRFAPILEVMEANNLLEEEEGKKVAVTPGGRRVLLKSDGTTLYLTRDVMAALDRWVTFQFDRMVYVVDNSQNQHFTALKEVLKLLEYDWVDRIEHVKFGRIQGMSTRHGQVIFLKDILDEAKNRMIEKQHQSVTTKNFSEEVADILGVSAIIVNDLKQRRMRDYSFDWTSALQMDGDSGVKLQYTHCRLHSLELNCGVALPDRCDPSLLPEPEALALVLEIARLEEAIERAHSKLEAYEIVNYLFKLCNKTNQALKTLNVKQQEAAVAEQRLLLFHRARLSLHCGMTLLGLRPLNEM